EQLQNPEPRDLVCRVVGQPQQRDEVLDMSCLQVPQAAILDVRDVPARELDLEQIGVVRRAAQDRLLSELHALLARLQHPLTYLGGLRRLVAAKDQLRSAPALP